MALTEQEIEHLKQAVEDLYRADLAKQRMVVVPMWWIVPVAIAGCALHPRAKA